jgi:hypothetical protein
MFAPASTSSLVLVPPERRVVRVNAADLTPGSDDIRPSTWRKIRAERSAS